MVTLLALTVAIGLLVDDAIVVVEAVQNDVDEGADATGAAHAATRAGCVGCSGWNFCDFGSVRANRVYGRNSWPLSSFNTVLQSSSPSASRCWLPSRSHPRFRPGCCVPKDAESGWFARIERFHVGMRQRYERLVSWAINRRYLVLGGALASVLIGGFFAALVPSTFMSTTDRSEFLATVKLPQGTGVSEAKKAAEQVDASLRQNPEVELVFVSAGSGINPKINELDVYIGLTPKRSREATQDRRDDFRAERDTGRCSGSAGGVRGGGSMGIGCRGRTDCN